MSPGYYPRAGPGAGFPRVSGDEPEVEASWRNLIVFSPRERG